MTIRLLIILLCCVFASQAANKIALTKKELALPPYRQFTLRDGLPQMQVISMLQDSRGYIWIGTKRGLACYNGERLSSLTTKDGLANDYIHDLSEDYSGNIWISTSLGLSCFDGKEITSYPLSEQNSFSISPARDGKIWILANERKSGLYFGYLEKGNYFPQKDNFPMLSTSGQPNEIAYSACDNMALITKYPHVYECRDGKTNIIFTTHDTLITIKSIKGRALYADLHNRRNFELYEYISGRFIELAKVREGLLQGKLELKDTIHFSFDNNFPVFTLTPDTFYTEDFHDIQKNQFLFDANGDLWIGSEEGVFRIYPEAFRTYKKEYLPQIWSVLEDNSGKMWFSSFHFGLKQYDGATLQSFSGLSVPKETPGFYFHPSCDRNGRLYYPFSYGILIRSGSTNQSMGTNPPYLTTFYDKERDLLWAGSLKKAEAFDARHRLIRTIGEKEGLATERYVLSINKDADGFYWLGSTGCLSKYKWETGEIINYTKENGRLPAEKIMTVFNDPQHRTWFGSSEGLLWYDAGKDSIFRLDCEELSGAVNLIASVDSSWLIVSQPAGIYLMDLQLFNKSEDIKLQLFNSANGYLGIEPGQDGAFTDSKGNIWMTSGSEVVRLNPKKLKMSGNLLNVRFLKCNGQSLPFNAAQFRLPSNDQTAIIEFDAICFNRPNPVQYSWKAGNNAEWSPWQESNYVVLSGLTDGKKLIQVRGRVPGLPLPEFATASLTLQVNLALFKQAWFFPALFGCILLAALIILILLFRTHTRMTQATRQSKVFQVQAIQSQMNPHFIFNALASLQTMILSVNMEKANEYLVKLAGLIRGFLEASVSTGKSGNKEIGNSEIILSQELETIGSYISFQQLIYPGRFDFVLYVDPLIDTTDQTIPPMLLQPFVENAIRHGLLPKKGNGTLKVSITPLNDRGMIIEIADNGIGIEKAGSIIKNSPFRFVSHGRELTLNRIRLMNETGYHIKVNTSSSDEGTTVTLEIK